VNYENIQTESRPKLFCKANGQVSKLHQPLSQGPHRRLGTFTHLELPEDILHMFFDSLHANAQGTTDFFIT
jgi:hypothetical protein